MKQPNFHVDHNIVRIYGKELSKVPQLKILVAVSADALESLIEGTIPHPTVNELNRRLAKRR